MPSSAAAATAGAASIYLQKENRKKYGDGVVQTHKSLAAWE